MASRGPPLFALLVIAICILWTSLRFAPRWEHDLPSSRKLASEVHSVGFDLTPSYGTAAVSYPNGSNIALAFVNSSQDYRDLIFKLSVSADQRFDDPSLDVSENETARIFAEMLSTLRNEAEQSLGSSIKAAAVTVPHFSLLSEKTVKAACATADLDYISVLETSFFTQHLTFHENTILAAHGFGLCQPFTAPPNCSLDLPWKTYYFIGYYADSLEVVTAFELRWAYTVSPFPYTNPSLGYRMRHRNSDEEFYWEEIRKWLIRPLAEIPTPPPTKVIIYGDGSECKRFRSVLDEVLETFFSGEKTPEIVDDGVDAVFAAAMGAAEFVKRKPYMTRHGLEIPKIVL